MKGAGGSAVPNGKSSTDMKAEAGVISSQLRERLASERIEYHKLMEQEKYGSFDASPELDYFILSTKFLKEWMDYSGYDEKDPAKGLPTAGIPLEPEPFNADILVKEKDQFKLKPDLVEHNDFEVVTKDIMRVFRNYAGTKIQRKAVRLANGKKLIEIYKLVFEYFILEMETAKSIAQEPHRKLVTHTAEISRYARLPQMKAKCLELIKRTNPSSLVKLDEIRIWKLEPEVSVEDFITNVKQWYSKRSNAPAVGGLNIPSKSIQYKRDETVADFNIADDDTIIIEVKSFINGWILADGVATPTSTYQNENYSTSSSSYYSKEKPCEYCRQYRPIKYKCQCNTVEYCSEECKYKDMHYHSAKCKYADEVDVKQKIDMSWKAESRRGVTGLSNLGNTCFMNSCLQCLSNTIPLTEYFLTNRFQDEINMQNPIGTKGKLTFNYAKTIRGLWCEGSSTYSPYILKSSIAEFQPMFSGYQQHDSQEFLSFLLDGLHEDLNRVIKKPVTETIESNGRPDNVVARESWTNFLRRNQSIIVDLFMGQYKSIVTCPTCNHESITFDPYSTLSLPIPQTVIHQEERTQHFYLLYSNFRLSTKKVIINHTGKTAKDWRSLIAKDMRLDPKDLKIFVLSFNDDIYEVVDDTPVDVVAKKIALKDHDLFCLELLDEDLEHSTKHKYKVFKFVNAANATVFTFQRPFYFGSAATGLTVYKRLFDYLYKLAILKEKSTVQATVPEGQFEKFFDKSKQPPFEIFYTGGKDASQLLRLQDHLDKIQADRFEVRLQNIDPECRKAFNVFENLDRRPTYTSSYHDPYENKEFTLQQCFEEFERVEKLDEGNQWYCPKCKKHQLAVKQMFIYKTPKVLVIHLKRFKQKADRWFATKAKMGCLVKFPLELNIEKYVLTKTLPQAYFHNSPTTQPLVKPPKSFSANACTDYELFAVSNHFGSMGGGHYTAYAKNNGTWYDYNDSSVHKISASQVVNRDAYMLFYLRKDTKEAAL